jgi:PAS domain-containing protein
MEQSAFAEARGKGGSAKGTGRDITELKRAEDALQAILATAMDAVVTVDEEQRIILFNPAAARLLLSTSQDAMGNPLDHFIPKHCFPLPK